MKRACWLTARLIDGRASGLTRAESLLLEEHVSTCASCAFDAGMLSQLQQLSDAAANSLQPTARARAIAGALEGHARQQCVCVPMRAWFWPSALGAALALAVIALGVTLRPAPTPSSAARVATDHLIAGQVTSSGRALGRDEQVPSEARLYSERGGTVALAHATVDLRTRTRADWRAGTRTLHLRAGSLMAEVDPTVGERFTVQTDRFRVLVLGTRFEVSADSVRVERGRVLVQSFEGRELAFLTSGQRYDRPQDGVRTDATRPAQAPAPSVAAPAKADATQESRSSLPADRTSASERSATDRAPAPRLTAAERLDQARVALASGEVSTARAIVDAVLSGRPDASWRAEALSLRAECSLVDGHLQAAVSGYLLVADRYSKLAAGENALFAAARIEAEHGEPARATAVLERYLTRYPQGRFVKEAERRVRALRATSAP